MKEEARRFACRFQVGWITPVPTPSSEGLLPQIMPGVHPLRNAFHKLLLLFHPVHRLGLLLLLLPSLFAASTPRRAGGFVLAAAGFDPFRMRHRLHAPAQPARINLREFRAKE